MAAPVSDVAFSPAVKAIQARKGSRETYARMEAHGGWRQDLTAEAAAFVEAQTSVFLATASAAGQPYIQHRGGPPGFLRVLDARTLAFADFTGNRQYVTQGNLQENPRACLFLMDYLHRRRIKIWGRAEVIEGDESLNRRLAPQDYRARVEQAVIFHIEAWDVNCPQHIPQRLEAADVAAALEVRDRRIAELESEVARLSAGKPVQPVV